MWIGRSTKALGFVSLVKKKFECSNIPPAGGNSLKLPVAETIGDARRKYDFFIAPLQVTKDGLPDILQSALVRRRGLYDNHVGRHDC